MAGYTNALTEDRQISMEERIASMIPTKFEEVAQEVSRQILYEVLSEFRPDLFNDFKGISFWSLTAEEQADVREGISRRALDLRVAGNYAGHDERRRLSDRANRLDQYAASLGEDK